MMYRSRSLLQMESRSQDAPPSSSACINPPTDIAAPSSNLSKKKLACAVCGDTARVRHYSVLSCNGCKGFFRRTVSNTRTYTCQRDSKCTINAKKRSCRACRYAQCIRVGMNPRAVQGDLNECRKNGVLYRKPKQRTERIGEGKTMEEEEQSDERDETIDDEESQHRTTPPQVSDSNTQTEEEENLSRLPQEIADLVNRFKRVCYRYEEQGTAQLESTMRVEFEVIYNHPELVSARTKLDPSAERVATVDDIMVHYRRIFVLYCDLMHATPEVQEISKSDQVTIARKNFQSFYWVMMALMSPISNQPGCCLSNGTYFPMAKELQQYPDVNDCAARCEFYLNRPIRELAFTEPEQAVVAYLACFTDDVPTLSAHGCKKYSEMRDKLLRYLHKVCGNTVKTRGMPSELTVVCRVSQIMSLFIHITDIGIRALNNMELGEMLQTVKFDWWMKKEERIV